MKLMKVLVITAGLCLAAFGAVAAELESSGFDVQLSAFVAPVTVEVNEAPAVAATENETTEVVKIVPSESYFKAQVSRSTPQAVLAGIAVDATNWDALIRKLSSGTNKAQPEHSESENPVYS